MLFLDKRERRNERVAYPRAAQHDTRRVAILRSGCTDLSSRTVLLPESDHHRLNVFRRPPLFHQEVDHAFGLDHEVAAEKEDAEDDCEREYAQHRDLHGARHEQLALVRLEHQRSSTGPASAVARAHLVHQRACELLAAVKQSAVRKQSAIEDRRVHGESRSEMRPQSCRCSPDVLFARLLLLLAGHMGKKVRWKRISRLVVNFYLVAQTQKVPLSPSQVAQSTGVKRVMVRKGAGN
ncbi:hypothetical protein KOW79_001436 [Hemibagrus wyckioides]|uniref:Uncharacterized protein n=1 Tax=Hemibagrus wyckioides TaxID=337641 RepID=A0A9D3P512_9TELE|nr:hypothetical protein KOW79_001436 [Hemibagrus wyckioides]